MALLVCQFTTLSRVKYLNIYWMDLYKIFFTDIHADDLSYQLWWHPDTDFLFNATNRTTYQSVKYHLVMIKYFQISWIYLKI